jgi:hypothetical protein
MYVNLDNRTHDEYGSACELVFFSELQSVGHHGVVDPGRVKCVKRFPSKANRIQFACFLGVLGAALVELLGFSGSAREHVKAKAALGAHVAKTLVFSC